MSTNSLKPEPSVAALLLVKEQSNRLPGKNTKDFRGKPMFVWNVLKCADLFDEVYVSSDSHAILNIARLHGAKVIHRGPELCGECPDIPVYQHALEYMPGVTGVVAVHANNPTVDKNLIATVKKITEMGVPETMTCHPITHSKDYHQHSNRLYGSVRGMTVEKLQNYGDPYKPEPDVLVVDDSIEIETPEDYELCLRQS